MIDGPASESPPGARRWLSFEAGETETTLVDTTFLHSNWRCIYGEGCPGVEDVAAPEMARGCCSFGAHFTGPDDRERVLKKADLLTPTQWQHADEASTGGVLSAEEEGEEGAESTRIVDGACIFLNRPGFANGPGCALHVGAHAAGEQPLEWKPDVCWQIPLRVEESEDDNGHTTRSVRAWLRRDWGEGGSDLGWWCTEPDGSYEGHEPVYRSLSAELSAILGEDTYQTLAGYLDAEAGL